MSDISIMAISQHELIRRLSLWEDKANPTAPMSAAQKDLLSELTVRASQRPILSDVSDVTMSNVLLQYVSKTFMMVENKVNSSKK